jgi:hypothetical protein
MSKIDEHTILEVLERVSLAEPAPEATARAIQRGRQTLANLSRTIDAPRKRRFLQPRVVKWLIPAVAAAAAVIVVGVWPMTGGNRRGGEAGKLYAFDQLPAMFLAASTVHEHRFYLQPNQAPPGQERRRCSWDQWVDLTAGRWAAYSRHVGPIPGTPGPKLEDWASEDYVCDGAYLMEVNHQDKTVEFTKPTAFKCLLMARQRHDAIVDAFAYPGELGYQRVGQEVLSGRSFEVWEMIRPPQVDTNWTKLRMWFSPAGGDVGRWQYWYKSPTTNDQWSEGGIVDVLERNIVAAPAIFSTDPPSGYTFKNTKETAPAESLSSGSAKVGRHVLRFNVCFTLPDGTILLGWSNEAAGGTPLGSPSNVADDSSEAAIFADLKPGGSLPRLPIEMYALEPESSAGQAAFSGHHLACTKKDRRFYEWSLYVPDGQVPARKDSRGYKVLARLNLRNEEERVSPPAASISSVHFVEIRDATDFKTFVLGAMADLSGTGSDPGGVTYDSVTQLTQQIREALKNQPAAGPADDHPSAQAPPNSQ